MADIFISYSHKDQNYVQELTGYLKNKGFSVWVDERIDHGDRWWQTIVSNIRKCAAMVVVMTPDSEKTDWVEREYFFADRNKKPIFPLLLGGECFPFFVNRHYSDVRDRSMPPNALLGTLKQFVEQANEERNRKEEEQKLIEEREHKRKEEEQKRIEVAQKAEEERKQKETKAKRRADEEQQRKEKEERKRRDLKTRVKTDKPEPDEKATIESIPSEPRKTGKALKFGALGVVIVLLIVGIWWWVSGQQVNEVRQELEKLGSQALNLEDAVAKVDKPEQLEELYRQRDTLSHQVAGISEQANKVGLRSQLEQLQNRLKQIQIQLANKENDLIAARKGKIFVASTPENATVNILNIDEPLKQGMKLEPGEYHIEVSLEGYESQKRSINISPGEEKRVSFKLEKIPPKVARLFVETFPEDATVRILNIKPKFFQGMELDPGDYHVEVAAGGYETERKWINLVAGHEKPVRFELTKVKDAEPISPQKTITNTIGMKFMHIPAGKFVMGSPSDEPGRDDDEKQHGVRISKPFYLQTTEVSQAQWKKVVGDNPSRFKNCGENCPVETVSWEDAQKFISKLNQVEGINKYRLPTEAEWEYACRAGTEMAYSFDGVDKLDEYAWYRDNSKNQTHSVGKKKPNNWGLYDMHGNVWEWCRDWYGDFPSNSVADPKGTDIGEYRVLRGGSWSSNARNLRSANRLRYNPDFRSHYGFRVVRDF